MPAKPPLDVRDALREEPALDPEPTSWRDIYEVHPCADVFPLMSDEEIHALATDIKDHDLKHDIVIWRPDAENPERICILDGRNRLDALEHLGVRFTRTRREAIFPDGQTKDVFKWSDTSDPAAYVISANIRRRHLTKAQQAELIVLAMEAGTNESATLARSFNPTDGRRGGSTKDPMLTAQLQQAQKIGVSKREVQRARAKVHGVPPRRKSKPPDRAATRAAKSDGSAHETSAPATPAAVSKKIGTVLRAVALAINLAVQKWPQGTSLHELALWLHVQADRLDKGDKATVATNAHGSLPPAPRTTAPETGAASAARLVDDMQVTAAAPLRAE